MLTDDDAVPMFLALSEKNHSELDSVDEDEEYEEQVVAPQRQLKERNAITAPLVTFTPLALKCIGLKTKPSLRGRFTAVGEAHSMTFKMNRSETPLIKTLLHSYGFTQCSPQNPNFNVLWTGTHLRAHSMRSLASWQRINHFPRSFELTRKDRCYINIDRAKQFFNATAFDFIPEFYMTPSHAEHLKSVFEAEKGKSQAPFIVKPARSSRGRGISIAETIEEVPVNTPMLVSRYIDDPLLVNGHKFDLRIYVLVTSFHPLIVYIYNDGLARFAAEKYINEEGSYGQTFAHLTNYSLNKFSDNFEKNKEMSDDAGHKWTLGGLLKRLHKDGIDTELLMVRIEDIIIKTLLSVQNRIASACRNMLIHSKCCFELFGFDVLIDNDLKPWLLEVNLSPSLACDAPLDSVLKTRLICDTFNVACIPLVSRAEPKVAQEEDDEDYENEDIDCGKIDDDEINRVAPRTAGQPPIKIPRLKTSLSVVSRIKKRTHNMRKTAMNFNRDISSGYCAENVNIMYEAKARGHVTKVNLETKRRGNFIRVFPRRLSWILYNGLMEDCGNEKWDKRLHTDLYGSDINVIDEEVVRRAHEELMDTKAVKSSNLLSEDVKKIVELTLTDAKEYRMKGIFEGGSYLPGLPKIRPQARKRTQSCVESDEAKEEARREQREAMLAAAAAVAEAKDDQAVPDSDVDVV